MLTRLPPAKQIEVARLVQESLEAEGRSNPITADFEKAVRIVRGAGHGKPTHAPINRINCQISVVHGDVLEELRKLEDNSNDASLFDGPYGLTSIGKRDSKPPKGFMGNSWDCGVPSREICEELWRVCKPGSPFLGFGHPRTYHRFACNVEDAGWEIRGCLMWLFGKALPKSHDLGKMLGDDTWDGYGTALKPAYEPIIMAMKPLDGTFAQNARKWGVAGININGCRIGHDEITINRWRDGLKPFGNGAGHPYGEHYSEGRYPPNVLLDEDAAHLLDLQSPVSKGGKFRKSGQRDDRHRGQQLYGGGIGGGLQNAPDCYGDAGGASRFFYCAKASDFERDAGLPDGLQNKHPCVKPIAVTEWLARLILPPERSTPRRLIVPYSGSGSEMIGAMRAGWDEVLGIEREEEYVAYANARIEYWRGAE